MSDVCVRNIVDILFLSETKNDASFPSVHFAVSGFLNVFEQIEIQKEVALSVTLDLT